MVGVCSAWNGMDMPNWRRGKMVPMMAIGLFLLASHVIAYVPPSIDFPAGKETLSQAELSFIDFAVQTIGLVAFTNVPGFAEARLGCLQAVAKCYSDGTLNQDATLEVTLQDGTKRVTLATSRLGEFGDYGCPELHDKLHRLQAIITTASLRFARALDEAVLKPEQRPLLMAVNNHFTNSYPNFESIVRAGNALDHLHIYEKRLARPQHESDDALEKHTDNGLFVAMVPAMSFKDGELVQQDDGFEIELAPPLGLTRVTFPDNGNSIIFMIGDGIATFLNLQSFRAVPHRLVVTSGEKARVWFGRMFFPPQDAYIQKHKTSYDKVRLMSIESDLAGSDLGFGGCSSNNMILRDLTEQACASGEMYCWMACRSTAGLSCSGNQTVQCVDSNTGQLWTDESNHCFSCGPQCYGAAGSNPSTSPTSTGFCNTNLYPTNMYMDGFNGLSSDIPCMIFLFQTWVMDTQVKYAFGSIGAFAIGLFIELVILIRRELMRERTSRSVGLLKRFPGPSTRKSHKCVLVTLYGIQLVFAYFAMLLAMSFSAVIFSMIMLGFVAGHALFNFQTPAGGNEACCAANETGVGETHDPILGLKTGQYVNPVSSV